jgi:RimJ/RimL family protein N-acetyltransferase
VNPQTAVTIKKVVESDLLVFYEQQLDKEALLMADFPSRDRESFFAHWEKIMADDTNYLRTILYNDQVAGNIVSFMSNGKREVGYWIGKQYWGKGIATNALRQFLQIVQERPLYAYTAKHNLASQRVLQKCGFQSHGETEKEIDWVLENFPG